MSPNALPMAVAIRRMRRVTLYKSRYTRSIEIYLALRADTHISNIDFTLNSDAYLQ